MSGIRIQVVTFLLIFFWLPIISRSTISGYLPPEATGGDKISLGRLLRLKGEFYEAIAVFEEALEIALNLNEDRPQLECLMQLGILHWNIGQINESASLYRKALALSQKLKRKDFETECASHLKIYESYVQGKEACASGSFKESIGHFSSAIELARRMKSPEHELKCLRQMSFNYFQLEAYSEYLAINKMGLEIARTLKHKKEEGRYTNNIGLSYLLLCEYSKALVLFNEALEIAQLARNSEQDRSTCLNNIGLAYCFSGHFEKALPYLEHALEIDLHLGAEEDICMDLNNIGITYSRKGRYLKNKKDLHVSLEYYLRSLDFIAKTNNKRSKIDVLNNIGLVYGTLGYYSAATKYFQSAILELDQVEYIYEACNIHCNLGCALFGAGKYHGSIEHFKKALELAARVGRDEILWEAYNGLGKSFEKIGQKEAALGCYRKAIDIVDLMRSRFALDDFKAAFARDKLKAYESLIHLLFSLKRKEGKTDYDLEIFQVIERAKARAFLEELSLGKGARPYSDDMASRTQQNALSSKISMTISNLTRPGLDEAQRKKLLARLETEEEEYTNLLNRIRTQRLENSRFTLPEIISIEEIQAECLDKKTAILEYYLGEKQSVGIFLDKKQLVLKALPPRMEIENSLRAYLKMLSAPPDGRFMGIPAAQRIYQELILPFEDCIAPHIEHLAVVPDGILHYLPFETLIKSDVGMGGLKYLIELYDISYAPSAASLAHLIKKKRPKSYAKTLLAVGDPIYLPGGIKRPRIVEKHSDVLREIFLKDGFDLSPLPYSRKEIRRVARCFPKEKVDVLLNSQAKEESIKGKALEEYQIIHFACHGFLDEKTPMRSALVLTLDDDVEEDGFLQAREISDLSLSADLVVLSACQTGKGRLENAEGVLGLPRTFFYAGAKSTLSSLWKISDKSTSEIMPSFYRYLTAGKNKARALRLAKLEMLQTQYSHPFYWAAFVLNGDCRWEANTLTATWSE